MTQYDKWKANGDDAFIAGMKQQVLS